MLDVRQDLYFNKNLEINPLRAGGHDRGLVEWCYIIFWWRHKNRTLLRGLKEKHQQCSIKNNFVKKFIILLVTELKLWTSFYTLLHSLCFHWCKHFMFNSVFLFKQYILFITFDIWTASDKHKSQYLCPLWYICPLVTISHFIFGSGPMLLSQTN